MELGNLTSADLPTDLLKTAYLTGKIPFRACRSDPRISYSLYIPSQRYEEVHRFQSVSSPATRLPLIVNIHGSRRDAQRCRDSLIEIADKHGAAVLTPLFPAALDDYMDLDSYKALRSKTLKSDVVLLSILDEVKHIWPGIETGKVLLVGFSGGAQFVHRFMYLYPERLKAVAVVSPGRTTKLSEEPWPAGVGDAQAAFDGLVVDADAIRKIGTVQLIIGGDDNDVSDILTLVEWLAKRKGRDAQPGDLPANAKHNKRHGRVDELQSLRKSWQENGIECELEIVPSVAHSYDGLLPTILEWLDGRLTDMQS